jgi:hypothetical protein
MGVKFRSKNLPPKYVTPYVGTLSNFIYMYYEIP